MLLPLTTAEHINFKNVRIAGDDDDFGEVRMEKVLAGMRRVKDVFLCFSEKCEEGGMGNAEVKWEKQKKIN